MLLRPVVRNGRPGLIGRTAGATIVVGLARRQAKGQQATAAQEAAATPPAARADPIAKLKDLAALKDQGILTEEEFAAQKARILEA
jgi:hypothetical protein